MHEEEENILDQEHRAQLKRKRLAAITFFACPNGDAQAILVVDAEKEEEPLRDEHGNLQYSCPLCHLVTRVDKQRHVVPSVSLKVFYGY